MPGMEYPKLRQVEAIPTRDNMICLRDPQGFTDKLLLLPRPVFFVVSLFDGRHSILDIQAEYTRRFGDLVFSDKVKQIVEQLDGALFLDSDRFREQRRKAIEEFRAASVRPASHAGLSYQAGAEECRQQLDALFAAVPEPESQSDLRPRAQKTKKTKGSLCGLIAPHIDLNRGGACFALSYAELARECSARTFVILGISHAPTRRSFVLTDKDFETPLGVVPADRNFLEAISSRCQSDFYEDEFVHRSEHSIEFQTLFLRYLYRDEERLRIVPILCSLPSGVEQQSAHSEDSLQQNPEVEEFIGALKAALAENGSEVCCIAGVDLSHMGQRFGQNVTVSPALCKQVETEDRAMIDSILEGKAEDFLRGIVEQGNRRNVCGVPAVYCLLRVLDIESSCLLGYEQAVDDANDSLVSFMAAAFYREQA